MIDISLLIIIIGVFLGFFVQTLVGFSAGLFALPIILFVLDLQEAVALMAVLLFIFSLILVPKNWRHINKKIVLEVGIGMILGLLIGIYILVSVDPAILIKLLGIFILFYVGYSYVKKAKIEIFNKLGFVFGTLGGIFSGIFASGGPLIAMYVTNKLNKANIIRGTIIGIFGISNFLRVPIFIYSNVLTLDIFLKSLYVLPFFLIALFAGHKLYRKINDELFKHIVMVVLVLSAVSLLMK